MVEKVEEKVDETVPEPVPANVEVVTTPCEVVEVVEVVAEVSQTPEPVPEPEPEVIEDEPEEKQEDFNVSFLRLKNTGLLKLKASLIKQIDNERSEIATLNSQLKSQDDNSYPINGNDCYIDEVMNLLHKENQILQIKKINLVRQIIEEQELCIEMKAKLDLLAN